MPSPATVIAVTSLLLELRIAGDLPLAAVVGLRHDATPDMLAISRSVMRRPNQIAGADPFTATHTAGS